MRTARLRSLAAAGFLLCALSGCAEKGPMLLEGVSYQATTPTAPAGIAKPVSLGTFTDLRGKQPVVVGIRTIREYLDNDLIAPKSAAELVRDALRGALAAQGIPVKDVPEADLVLGGEVRGLWVDVVSQPLKVTMKAEVQLRMSLTEGAGRTVARTITVSSKLERENIAFSLDMVAATLSEALSSALDQLLKDDELKKKIHRATYP